MKRSPGFIFPASSIGQTSEPISSAEYNSPRGVFFFSLSNVGKTSMLERTFMIAKKKFKKAISQWRRARVRVIVLAGQGKAGKDVFLSYFRRNYSNLDRKSTRLNSSH